ncbi:MAG TPA: hypothetical protein VI750_13815, partial [Pyrinomonadaceae bacterium]|nr:hypothetical protein [Pyrinomonadaceae bacterium]
MRAFVLQVLVQVTEGERPVSDLRLLLKFRFPAFATHGSRWTHGTLRNLQPPRPDIPTPTAASMKPRRTSPLVPLFPRPVTVCGSSRAGPEAWTHGWRGMSRHYHNERKYRKTDTAPLALCEFQDIDYIGPPLCLDRYHYLEQCALISFSEWATT